MAKDKTGKHPEQKKIFRLAINTQRIFNKFYLAGGTAIMFKYNHRKSIDIDFFNPEEFSFNRLSKKLRQYFKVEDEQRFTDNIDFYIEGIRVSFVFFPFKNLTKSDNVDGLMVASDYDLFLNKVYSAGRRVEGKDPFDAAYLYRIHNWDSKQLRSDFQKKFPDQSYKIYLGALLSFDDYPGLEDWVKEELLKLII